eukprot:CAMPEP_0179604104 /NCGR_PEP_ID=MMETSP0930-20121108/233_1 /TAXON_ID=548131 ORGANISM="Ostreococcus mediterraneus, Strain clade-D-RCC1621" /NCGR_SAMPLE_ID=MMETSP0930 /ASSEMBLY_ACC=CAM_ASM_000580 /LENGTH=120 /DNA_ID=CAMNT_0021472491 /DNA_START=46 /DNA_END=408 /DNA_ORIENTATION=+
MKSNACGSASGHNTVTKIDPERIELAVRVNRVIVDSSHVTQLQNTKSASVHDVSEKMSPRRALTVGVVPSSRGATSRKKSSITHSAMACAHGKISIPWHARKYGESAAVTTDLPAPLPKS